MTKNTPVRNNYAAPHTPITSVKRPRSSLERGNNSSNSNGAVVRTPSETKQSPASSTTTASTTSTTSTTTPSTATTTASNAATATPSAKEATTTTTLPPPPPAPAMSPMHPPRPVHREDGNHEANQNQEETTKSPTLDDEEESSASWVGRKVDALFSPVLSFLSSNSTEEEAAAVTDEDVTMADEPPIKAQVSEEEEEEEEEAELEEDPSSEDDDVDEEEFNPYLFIKSLPRYDAVKHLRPPVALPAKDKDAPDVTLVLDLDETLVHCTVEQTPDADLTFPVVFHGMEYIVHVKLRPHVFEFLEKICNKFEVVVFTASQKVYADELLNRIDPEGKYIQHRLFRESCLAVEGNFLKDLNVLGRDMSKMVLVDNSPHAFGYQVDNGIPIESWFDDPTDTELLKLEKYLQTLHTVSDVRSSVRQTFETYRKVAET